METVHSLHVLNLELMGFSSLLQPSVKDVVFPHIYSFFLPYISPSQGAPFVKHSLFPRGRRAGSDMLGHVHILWR